ncbi:hypothetical protein A2U01_0110705, partial [Trifolium medium]|nr:hypothetical protein [Trifolium medium]
GGCGAAVAACAASNSLTALRKYVGPRDRSVLDISSVSFLSRNITEEAENGDDEGVTNVGVWSRNHALNTP